MAHRKNAARDFGASEISRQRRDGILCDGLSIYSCVRFLDHSRSDSQLPFVGHIASVFPHHRFLFLTRGHLPTTFGLLPSRTRVGVPQVLKYGWHLVYAVKIMFLAPSVAEQGKHSSFYITYYCCLAVVCLSCDWRIRCFVKNVCWSCCILIVLLYCM